MLRAARLVRARNLELRVVGLPEGADPADLLLRDGPEALVERVAGSQPFVVFNVERILERADLRSAEGRDRALDELGPVMADVPAASVLRDDLMRRIAGRLEVTGGRLVTLLAAAADRAARGEVPRRAQTIEPGDDGPGPTPTLRLDPGPRSERLFLALCIALPDRGTAALEAVDIDEVLTSGSLRRAAHHLQGRLGAPLSDLPADDEEFARLMAGLVELAGRVPDPSAHRLEHARLVLERDRLDRAIIRVRGQGAGTGDLARERETIREAIRAVGSDLESAF
jgi:DNA primase